MNWGWKWVQDRVLAGPGEGPVRLQDPGGQHWGLRGVTMMLAAPPVGLVVGAFGIQLRVSQRLGRSPWPPRGDVQGAVGSAGRRGGGSGGRGGL